jgi:hypothetical protein
VSFSTGKLLAAGKALKNARAGARACSASHADHPDGDAREQAIMTIPFDKRLLGVVLLVAIAAAAGWFWFNREPPELPVVPPAGSAYVRLSDLLVLDQPLGVTDRDGKQLLECAPGSALFTDLANVCEVHVMPQMFISPELVDAMDQFPRYVFRQRGGERFRFLVFGQTSFVWIRRTDPDRFELYTYGHYTKEEPSFSESLEALIKQSRAQ